MRENFRIVSFIFIFCKKFKFYLIQIYYKNILFVRNIFYGTKTFRN